MVEDICTQTFYKLANIKETDENIILSAAGNIKYIFNDKKTCQDFVAKFPKLVMQKAPGITVSQSVVAYENTNELPEKIQVLEKNLRIQRNLPPSPIVQGFMGLERARRTGGVGFKRTKDDDVIDQATDAKLNARDHYSLLSKASGITIPESNDMAFDISDITASGTNSWIAVIHADGNGLGTILQNSGKFLTENNEFNSFSKAIDEATKAAIQEAFDVVINKDKAEKAETNPKYKYPIRPILIGGDDVTVIVRADLALDFTETFLNAFEKQSVEKFKGFKTSGLNKGLTACAGIAYVKESYPLHYALHLAEELCKDAKKEVKKDLKGSEMPKSSLAFYKVQDSFVKPLKELKEDTLKTKEELSFYAGPYLLPEVEQLQSKLQTLKEAAAKSDKTKVVGKLRQIVSELYKNESTANFMLERLKQINPKFYKDLDLASERKAMHENKTSQLLDLITLNGFNYGNRQN
ncbi:hypothetical protein [Mangrovimonas sp. TPBH4]|uniref:Cas10/Cmr2 second palm domain-containing protein n=1 Tax=Mangrovimonas sp. TPBH4 TaxID=1645914 RepID=UPI0012FAEBA3|nr:hypothetical protein [Mangrovimonas sp. TPBH4]